MAALEEGCEYGLSACNAPPGSRSVVHLKLTDSALRAIEDFLKIQGDAKKGSTIQFKGNNGVIQLPSTGHMTDDQDAMRTFQFSVSSMAMDPNGSFDCAQHTVNRSGNSKMETLGSMLAKISVHATDDVYRTTRQRMTQVEEARKKDCAQEIKPGGRYIGHKIKKVVAVAHSKNRNPFMSSASGNSNNSAISKAGPKPLTNSNNNLNSAMNNNHNTRTFTNGQGPHSVSRPNVANSVISSSSSSSKNTVSSSSSLSSSGKPQNSAIMNYPLRERVIHLLAIRPYKKPELLVRLQKDGVKEKDKNCLTALLQTVSSFSYKDNTFTLAKHLYGEVKQTWPFYTETDKQLLMRRINLENRCASTSPSPVCSPAQSSPESPSNSQQQVQKRPLENYTDPHNNKKPRISHYENRKKENRDVNIPQKEEVTSTTSPKSERTDDAKAIATSTIPDLPDFTISYTPILSKEQRQKYKAVFNVEYNEYKDLHICVEKVSKKFAELEEKIGQVKHGSEDYENLRKKIVTEYKTQKGDTKFVEQKRRFEYLHKKLAYIKQLVLEFDKVHILAS